MIEEMIGKKVTVIAAGGFGAAYGTIYSGILKAVDDDFIKIDEEGKRGAVIKRCINKKYIFNICESK